MESNANLKIKLTHTSVLTKNEEKIVETNKNYIYSERDAFVWHKVIFEALVTLLNAYETNYGLYLELEVVRVIHSKNFNLKEGDVFKPFLKFGEDFWSLMDVTYRDNGE